MATANRFGGGGTIREVRGGWGPPPGDGTEDEDTTWETEGSASAWELMLEALEVDDAADAVPAAPYRRRRVPARPRR
jgi:hypothetical protein